VEFQDRRLRSFKSTKGSVLTDFVAQFPEKKGYFELKNDVMAFKFPEPGHLDGVKSKSKALIKMSNVTFQYPTRDSPTVMDIHLQASRVSRVAVIGANGAGKSTAIKLLTGELKATSGEVWRHPNLRLAYIAQHAFQHLEKHLLQTPVQYILERFAGNDDKEAIDFKAGEMAQDKEIQKKQYYVEAKTMTLKACVEKGDFQKAVEVEAVLARKEQKKPKCLLYQCKWMGKGVDEAFWVERDILIKMGHLKMAQRQDEKEAMAAGLMSKFLTTESIENHLSNFGLTAEVASHTQIQSLSGGQKVKVVLGASLWQDPHIVILDEPTNYLDRDGLGALTLALQDYGGGVIIISHNREFANAVATEKWIMKAGNLKQEGESLEKGAEASAAKKEEDKEVRDGFGNLIDVKKQVLLSDKDKKKEVKELEKKITAHKKGKAPLDEDEVYTIEDRLLVLKEELTTSKGGDVGAAPKGA
jgi:elongation factor 3